MTPSSVYNLPRAPSDQVQDQLNDQITTAIRRSTRVVTKPNYLRHFHCSVIDAAKSVQCTSPHLISGYILRFSVPYYRNFALSVSMEDKPQFYYQAIKYPHSQDAMKEELSAMENNNTWSVVPLPPGKKSISCRWIVKNKFNADGTLA